MRIFELKQLNLLPFCILQMFFYFQLGHLFHSEFKRIFIVCANIFFVCANIFFVWTPIAF